MINARWPKARDAGEINSTIRRTILTTIDMRRACGTTGPPYRSQLRVPSTEAGDGPSINSSRTGDSRMMVLRGTSGIQGRIRRIRRDKIARPLQISSRSSPGNGSLTLSPRVTQVSHPRANGASTSGASLVTARLWCALLRRAAVRGLFADARGSSQGHVRLHHRLGPWICTFR